MQNNKKAKFIEIRDENWARDKMIAQQKMHDGIKKRSLFTQLSGKFQNNWIEVAKTNDHF